MDADVSPDLPNLWDPAAVPSDAVDELIYASNLLGSDRRITNFGGGNTSVKTRMPDPLTGKPVRVLWVKGSGGDLGTATRSGFASLYLDKVLGLEARFRGITEMESGKSERAAPLHEDDIVPLYAQCVFDLNPAAPSIDTPLHAFVPHNAVAHTHPDAVIAVASSAEAERLTREVWQGELGFLPWKRPGLELALLLRDLIEENPGIKGALMQSHGLICWGDDWRAAYETTLRLINRAQRHIGTQPGKPFGQTVRALEAPGRRDRLIELLPALRGKVAHEGRRLVASVDQSPAVLEFLASEKMPKLASMGTSCPDHFLRTKIRPMVLEDGASLDASLDRFRSDYADYYARCRHPDSPPMRNPNPSIVLLPGAGMVSFGKSAAEARITGEFYRNAIEVMRGAEAIGAYSALPEQEAFDIEYWHLEEAKLRRMPPDKELAGRVAIITGAAQGIGRAAAIRLASLGACVVMLDINEDKLASSAGEAAVAAGTQDGVRSIRCDVTRPASLVQAFGEAVLSFGGIDIAVVNAGNARRGNVAETSIEDYSFLSDLLIKAYFDTVAEATRILVRQGTGGSIVFVGSKNAVAVGSNAALYSAAKAFELHLMRTVAVDFAQYGIRCNAINPDAVIQGSGIWSDEWRSQTAANLGISPEELPEYYRKRTLLGVSVTPEDCAEAIAWLASDRSSRTTGAVLPVDGGVRGAFLR